MSFRNVNVKAVSTMLSLVAGTLLFGCGGSQKLLAVKNYKKVAIVEISANKTIDWYDDHENDDGSSVQSTVKFIGALSKGKSLSEAADEAKHKATNALNLCAGDIYKTIVESELLAIQSEDFVKSNPYFQSLESDKNVADFEVSADGYKLLKDDEEKYAEFCKALGVDAILTVRVSFQKELFTGVAGSGQAKGIATAFVNLYDMTGEEIWRDQNFERSENSTGMLSGAYKFDEMEQLCSQAAVSGTKKCMEKLKKELASLDKK